MLGMMNCPTENLEFYASPPSATRQLQAVQDSQEVPEGTTTASACSNGLEVFSARKHRPQISYTAADGRRLVDGKLAEDELREPNKMWSRAIVDSFTTRQLCQDQEEDEEQQEEEGEGEQQTKRQKTKTAPNKKRSFSLYGFLPKLKKPSRKSSYNQQSSRTHQQQKC